LDGLAGYLAFIRETAHLRVKGKTIFITGQEFTLLAKVLGLAVLIVDKFAGVI